jgi:hypothetical protein
MKSLTVGIAFLTLIATPALADTCGLEPQCQHPDVQWHGETWPAVNGKCPEIALRFGAILDKDMICRIDNSQATEAEDEGETKTVTAPTVNNNSASHPGYPTIVNGIKLGWAGLTDSETLCLYVNGPIFTDHDLIQTCNVPEERYGKAMDLLILRYRKSGRNGIPWVDDHCHAETAMPRNKWVCTEGDVTWEWH